MLSRFSSLLAVMMFRFRESYSMYVLCRFSSTLTVMRSIEPVPIWPRTLPVAVDVAVLALAHSDRL